MKEHLLTMLSTAEKYRPSMQVVFEKASVESIKEDIYNAMQAREAGDYEKAQIDSIAVKK